MDFAGKVVLITGASSGIGAATAIYISKLGAQLVLVGRNVTNLTKVAEQCVKNPEAPLSIQADLRDEKAIENIIKEIIEKFGKLDVLVNNAGILERGSIENTSLEQYDNLMNTNVRSVYYLTMLATPHLINSKGNIVNVSSVNGIRSFAGVLAYTVSKAALDQLTRCVSLELAPKGVRVNSVNPGVIITDIHKRSGMSEAEYADYLERCKETHALGRVGQPEEVASAIAYMASDLASNITGVTLPVDGGRHAMCPR